MFIKSDIINEVIEFSEFASVNLEDFCVAGTSSLVLQELAATSPKIFIEVSKELFKEIKDKFPNAYSMIDLRSYSVEYDSEEENQNSEFVDCVIMDNILIFQEDKFSSGSNMQTEDGVFYVPLTVLSGFRSWLSREIAFLNFEKATFS